MYTRFYASESVEIAVEEQGIPIQHYLRQPQNLVKAISEPQLREQLSEDHFRLKMRPLNFMEIYHFQPMVILKVWSGDGGTVHLNSQDCEIRGIEYINDRFSLNVDGKLFPYQRYGKTYLKGKADLEVKVELPPPLLLTPKFLLEMTGNHLLKSVLVRIKLQLLTQLLKDYRRWAGRNIQQEKKSQLSLIPTAENSIA
ncbi:MAG: DUF1997 domain-containing protein [Moorea sp. SIO2B7]|nr:DUF1997 domain-containing protein [Moorena sp. SIO2B7]